ncbi:dTMP kinase [Nocardiopsis sp. MG754419]|uniref:dTMP kinase n=1 Tax=Nocardiopsis sp. MG754419 TaxID=2259865 RepID=UPI001BA6DDA6|nr:dTMP kinase [Nocardiopsis sp. MG754419]MBR8743312.1 dTMP kinase [Nocardiopsis sp. MG754419]
MSRSAPLGAPAEAQNVLAITPFRRLWVSLSLSSLGDWLSLLALVSLAVIFTSEGSALVQYLVVAAVLTIKLAPAVLLSPLAASVADRLDRRWTMVGGDVLRGLLYVSIPVMGLLVPGFALQWLLIAGLLAEIVALFWTPARDATIVGLVPKRMQGQADRLTLLATYGAAPVAALLFAALASIGNLLGALVPSMADPAADVALYLNAVTFFVAAIVVVRLPLPKHTVAKSSLSPNRDAVLMRALGAGRGAVGTGPLTRGVLIALAVTGAAGGLIIGAGRPHVENLGAGNAGFGVLVAALFLGLGLGLVAAPRVLKQFSRRRFLGLSVILAALSLFFAGAVTDMVLSAVLVFVMGLGAGLTWAIGTRLINVEVEEDRREAAFALLHATGRIALLTAAVLAPIIAGFAGDHEIPLGGPITYSLYGTGLVLMAGGLVALVLAIVAHRQANTEDPEAGPGLLPELFAALRGVDPRAEEAEESDVPGTFIVLEGGEGAGKSTQVRDLTVWLRDQGFEVLGTRQPGATKLGMRLRGILLDRENSHITDRAEVLLYAADKADHVEQEILPALRRGAVVISDRYVDSLLAYQGAGRDLAVTDVEEISDWATQGLVPDLTVLLDVRPEDGLARLGGPADRIESESTEFHERVRKGFRALAEAHPDRYLVLDANEPREKVAREIQRRVRPLLPDPVDAGSEAVTGMIPVIKPE